MGSQEFQIANLTDEEQVYFAKCSKVKDDFYDDDKQIIVEIEKEEKESEDKSITKKEILENIEAVSKIVKGSLKIVAVAAPEFAPILLSLAGVAEFIEAGVKLADDGPDPVEEAIENLEEHLYKLEMKMNEKFANLKSHIVNVEFTMESISEASTLMKYMRDVLKHRSPEAVNAFRMIYEQYPPLITAYTMLSILDQKVTNPLFMELNSETIRKSETFKKWEDSINGVLSQLLLVEAFAAGLLKNKNSYNCQRITERSNDVAGWMSYWKQAYGKTENYWEEVTTWFDEEFLPNNKNLNNREKAQAIKNKLETYLTNDQFYICVFNQSVKNAHYALHCNNWSSQICAAWNRDGCNVFIYRCKKAYELKEFEFVNTQNEVSSCRYNKLFYTGPLDQMIKEQLLATPSVRPDGLVCLIDMRTEPHVEYANCPRLEKGPGYWVKALVKNRDDASYDQDYLLLVGLP